MICTCITVFEGMNIHLNICYILQEQDSQTRAGGTAPDLYAFNKNTQGT
jgi:hypothetical protein